MVLQMSQAVCSSGLPSAYKAFRSLSGPSDALPLPESPRWLIEMNRKSEASEVIARLMGGEATVDHPEAIFQRCQIESSLEIESAGGPFKYSELFEDGKFANFRRVCICCAVQAMQQFTGTYRASTFFLFRSVSRGVTLETSALETYLEIILLYSEDAHHSSTL
jgi:hypothetical protein